MALMLSSLNNMGRGHMEYSLPLNGVIDLDALDEYLMSDIPLTTAWVCRTLTAF
jgi:hypothetical protein